MQSYLSPAETAIRFGISIKALRVYEQHGLLKPLRTSNGATRANWRAYGPDQLVRLHQILALKRLGLSLAQIGELLVGEDSLDPILAFQEKTLVENSERIARALTLIRKARFKLAAGETLSIDDLATLSQETVVTNKSAVKELKEIFAPFEGKHLTPGDVASVKAWTAGQPDVVTSLNQLLEEARALMMSGDATTPAAIDFARRFRSVTEKLKSSEPSAMAALRPKMKAMVDDARSDPGTSQKLEILCFVENAVANLKAQEAPKEQDK
jgi:DNA-binding transcriptional MerR regulator